MRRSMGLAFVFVFISMMAIAEKQAVRKTKTKTMSTKVATASPLRQRFREATSGANTLSAKTAKQVNECMDGKKTGLMRLPPGYSNDLVVCDLLEEYPGNDILFYYPNRSDPDIITYPTSYTFRIYGFIRDTYYPVWEFETINKYQPNENVFSEFVVQLEVEAICRNELNNNALGKTSEEVVRLFIQANQYNQNLSNLERLLVREIEKIERKIEKNEYAIVVAIIPYGSNGYVLEKGEKGYRVVGCRRITPGVAQKLQLSKEELLNLGGIEIDGESYHYDSG